MSQACSPYWHPASTLSKGSSLVGSSSLQICAHLVSITSDQATLSVQGVPAAPPMIPDDFFSDPGTYTKDAPAPVSAPSSVAPPVVQNVPSGSLPKEK